MKHRSGFFWMFALGLACGSLLMVFSVSAFAAAADNFPSKPVRFIVPWPPGGAVDIIARLVAPRLSEKLGKPVVIDNRGGAGGTLGLEAAAKSDPDGYTVSIISDSYAYKPALEKLPFDPVKAFAPIGHLATGTNVLVVHSSVPAKNVKEFIALLKQKPGQMICAASGNASVSHLTAELFKLKSGTDFKVVQFKGSGPALVDLLGGHSQFSFFSLLVAQAESKTGKIRILGTSGSKRTPLMPELPTIAEAGVPGHDAPNWWGMVAPAGTPQPIIDKLSQALKAALSTPEAEKQFWAQGADADYKGPKELGALLESEIAKWTQVIKTANIKVED